MSSEQLWIPALPQSPAFPAAPGLAPPPPTVSLPPRPSPSLPPAHPGSGPRKPWDPRDSAFAFPPFRLLRQVQVLRIRLSIRWICKSRWEVGRGCTELLPCAPAVPRASVWMAPLQTHSLLVRRLWCGHQFANQETEAQREYVLSSDNDGAPGPPGRASTSRPRLQRPGESRQLLEEAQELEVTSEFPNVAQLSKWETPRSL